jgi:hypothetical protein
VIACSFKHHHSGSLIKLSSPGPATNRKFFHNFQYEVFDPACPSSSRTIIKYMAQQPKGTGQWLSILSPHDGRKVRWRLKDLGRPIVDFDDRTFYVHKRAIADGYYGSFTRKGGPRQEAQYNQLVLKEARSQGKVSQQVAQAGIAAAKDQAKGIVPTGPVPGMPGAKRSKAANPKSSNNASRSRKARPKTDASERMATRKSISSKPAAPKKPKIQKGMGPLRDKDQHLLPEASQSYRHPTTAPPAKPVDVSGPIPTTPPPKLPDGSQAFDRSTKMPPKKSKTKIEAIKNRGKRANLPPVDQAFEAPGSPSRPNKRRSMSDTAAKATRKPGRNKRKSMSEAVKGQAPLARSPAKPARSGSGSTTPSKPSAQAQARAPQAQAKAQAAARAKPKTQSSRAPSKPQAKAPTRSDQARAPQAKSPQRQPKINAQLQADIEAAQARIRDQMIAQAEAKAKAKLQAIIKAEAKARAQAEFLSKAKAEAEAEAQAFRRARGR